MLTGSTQSPKNTSYCSSDQFLLHKTRVPRVLWPAKLVPEKKINFNVQTYDILFETAVSTIFIILVLHVYKLSYLDPSTWKMW